MSNPARKRYYWEAVAYTRWRPLRRVTVVHGDTPFTATVGGGMMLTGSRWTLTLESRPGAARQPPPVLVTHGSYTETWEA